METAEIRRRFLQYFGERGHTVVPSAPLLFDDPNLLFVNAGMVQFVPYLIGQETPPYKRATSVQKCVRTLDIEEVGKTTRHGTFFQMNGNFSFGDYFKKEAVAFAWEFVTQHLGFDPNKVWVTVLHSDDEAVGLWRKVAGLPDERIQRRGLKDNYWHMGIPGPGGPCSEIYIDRGPEYGPDGGPVVDEDRFLEIWNLVFMQEQLSAVRAKDDFDTAGELPSKNIDTGMGLERVAYLLQGVDNLYEIDEVYPVIERATELTGRPYGANHVDDVRYRVVGDHVRSALMLIGDGVRPGNEARGYVLRRLIRRVVRSMRLLGVEDRTLPELLPVSKDRMRTSYPELAQDWNRISQIAYAEEDAFRETLKSGTQIFENAVIEARTAGESELTGWKAFQLHDTYGFPIDLTLEMASEQGLRVDEPEFRRLMTEQRERAKADARSKKTKHADLGAYRTLADDLGRPVEFTGYDEVVSEATVRGIMTDDGAQAQTAQQGDEIELVLDRTPFYAEGGGQLADAGVIELQNGARIEVVDVQSPINGLIVHSARVLQGEVELGAGAHALVDIERRRSISRSHTATHMVHKAIREALGDTATQAGSENSPGRFRFDFSATGAVPGSVLQDVEGKVNDLVLADLAVEAEIMTQEQAKASGAMALFGEKYGDQVRVISVGEWARELCGGTHTHRSGQLGVIKLLGESSIGSGVRRIEALVGADAYRFLAREHVLVAQLSEALKAPPQELPDRVADLVARLRNAEKEIERVRAGQVLAVAGELAAKPRDVFGVSYVGHRTPDGVTGGDLRKLALDVRGRMPADRPAVVTIIGTADGKPGVVVALNDTARSWRLKAGDLVRVAAEALGGRGGGKDDVAQGGGTNPGGVDAALAGVEHAIGQQVTGG